MVLVNGLACIAGVGYSGSSHLRAIGTGLPGCPSFGLRLHMHTFTSNEVLIILALYLKRSHTYLA